MSGVQEKDLCREKFPLVAIGNEVKRTQWRRTVYYTVEYGKMMTHILYGHHMNLDDQIQTYDEKRNDFLPYILRFQVQTPLRNASKVRPR